MKFRVLKKFAAASGEKKTIYNPGDIFEERSIRQVKGLFRFNYIEKIDGEDYTDVEPPEARAAREEWARVSAERQATISRVHAEITQLISSSGGQT